MNRPIPEQIVAALDGLGALLAEWCEEGRDQPLASHEVSVLGLVRRVLPRLLEAVVEAATSGLDQRLRRARQACPGCGRKTQPWEASRARQVVTQCGPVALARPWYHCRACRRGWSVVETVLAVPSRAQTSVGLRQWGLELAASLPYREAAERLDSLTGIALGPETLRRLAVQVGTTIAEAEGRAAAQVARTQEAAEPVDPAPGLLVVEADGTMIRYLGRGVAILREALILGDGAAWIWKLADDHWTDRVEVVDFYHASEHLAACAQAAFGDTTDGRDWLTRHRHSLLTAGPAPVRTALAALTASTPTAREALRRERGYFRQHAERMAYDSR